MPAFRDLTGRRFGMLTVVSRAPNYVHARGEMSAWFYLCDCGTFKSALSGNLMKGAIISCGCHGKAIIGNLTRRHGKSHTKIHRTWLGIKNRCLNSRAPRYKDYGGRGITICDRWKNSFENFLADMGEPPSPNHSIDRIDVNGNYEPGNCRWSTASEQRSNQRPRKKKNAA